MRTDRAIASTPWACYALACDFCGELLDTEEEVNPYREGIFLVCDACHHARSEFTCAWCGEYDDRAVQHRYLAVYDAGAAELALPGLYRIDRCPYYTDAMLSAWIEDRAVTWLGYLPAHADPDNGNACGHFCLECQQKALAHSTYMLRCGVAALA